MACPHLNFIPNANFPLKLLKLIFNRSAQIHVSICCNSLFTSGGNEGAGRFDK